MKTFLKKDYPLSDIRRYLEPGPIVLVSSTAGQRGEAGHADYAATKGAIISMVKGLCVELGGRDIRVRRLRG